MDNNIKQAYEFDFVHDAQKVFRELLDAVANPGMKKNIREQASKFDEVYAPLTAVGCTLLDNEQKMYVEKNPVLASKLHHLTLCQESDLKEADYVFLSSEMNYGSMTEILKNVKKGSYTDPQDSATVFVLCQEIEGKSKMTISGPGVDKTKTMMVNQYVKTIIRLRQEMETEYPLGTDLVFADPYGEILGIPRLVKIEE